jgi:hypothetical protein
MLLHAINTHRDAVNERERLRVLRQDFWAGMFCGLRLLSSILVLVVAPDPELSATTFIPSVWREVKIVVGRVHKVDAGTNELNTCERRYLPRLS